MFWKLYGRSVLYVALLYSVLMFRVMLIFATSYLLCCAFLYSQPMSRLSETQAGFLSLFGGAVVIVLACRKCLRGCARKNWVMYTAIWYGVFAVLYARMGIYGS